MSLFFCKRNKPIRPNQAFVSVLPVNQCFAPHTWFFLVNLRVDSGEQILPLKSLLQVILQLACSMTSFCILGQRNKPRFSPIVLPFIHSHIGLF